MVPPLPRGVWVTVTHSDAGILGIMTLGFGVDVSGHTVSNCCTGSDISAVIAITEYVKQLVFNCIVTGGMQLINCASCSGVSALCEGIPKYISRLLWWSIVSVLEPPLVQTG